jgi:hypothetical protein
MRSSFFSYLSNLQLYASQALYTLPFISEACWDEPARSIDKTLPPGALITFYKGLLYVGIEEVSSSRMLLHYNTAMPMTGSANQESIH